MARVCHVSPTKKISEVFFLPLTLHPTDLPLSGMKPSQKHLTSRACQSHAVIGVAHCTSGWLQSNARHSLAWFFDWFVMSWTQFRWRQRYGLSSSGLRCWMVLPAVLGLSQGDRCRHRSGADVGGHGCLGELRIEVLADSRYLERERKGL